MDVRQSPFGTLSVADLNQVNLKITKVVTPHSELEKVVELHRESRQRRADADAFMASMGIVPSGSNRSSAELPPMTMAEYLLTFADRMEAAAKREGSEALGKTAEGLREQAAEVSAHGTTVDPLMVLLLQEKLFQKGGTYGPPQSRSE